MRSAVLLIVVALADGCAGIQGPRETQTSGSSPGERACRVGRAKNEASEYLPGHLVVFKYSSSSSKTGRAVTMSGEFGDLRVGHQDFFLSAAPSIPTCTSGGPG